MLVVVYQEVHGSDPDPSYMKEQFALFQKSFLDFAVKWPLWTDALIDAYLAGEHNKPQPSFPPASPSWDNYR